MARGYAERYPSGVIAELTFTDDDYVLYSVRDVDGQYVWHRELEIFGRAGASFCRSRRSSSRAFAAARRCLG